MCTGKVGQSFVAESEWRIRLTAGAFALCTKGLVKLTPEDAVQIVVKVFRQQF